MRVIYETEVWTVDYGYVECGRVEQNAVFQDIFPVRMPVRMCRVHHFIRVVHIFRSVLSISSNVIEAGPGPLRTSPETAANGGTFCNVPELIVLIMFIRSF